MSKVVRTIDKETCINILKGRVLADSERVIKHVQVTNVSFVDENDEPFEWEEGSSSEGEPYAIANFNIVNKYGMNKALELFKDGEFQEACNQNLSARVTPEMGQALRESIYANLDIKERMVRENSEDENSEKVPALLIGKVIPEVATVGAKAFDAKSFDADVFAEVEEEADTPDA